MKTKRERLDILRSQLLNERSTFVSHWRDLGDYILPRRPRFFTSDANKGDRRNQKIVDTTPILSARTMRSGMMSGITSPARPWFKLTTPDPAMSETASVKAWLDTVNRNMAFVFLRSNLYQTLPVVYGDLGVFGTAPMMIEEDMDKVIRTQSFPIGSYMIAKDVAGKVNVFGRDFRMTVRQVVEMFGKVNPKTGAADWSTFSANVKRLWDNSEYENWVDVTHMIEPNYEHDPRKLLSKYKKFASTYYESGQSVAAGDKDRFLRESGYDIFPVMCPRWEVTGEDVYGTACPGMDALGDIKQLQLGEKRIMQAIEKMVNPPMTAPSSMKNQKASILPGDITYVDAQQGFRPAHEINPRIVELENKQAQVRGRISRAFFEDLFLMLSQSDRREITAREIDERHEEKLLALGPVLEQLNQDLLDPTINVTFSHMLNQSKDARGNLMENGLVPPPPKELEGVELKVEYISIMAQAQKLISIGGVERFAGFVQQVAAFSPESADKVDIDQMIDVYADITSVPSGIVRPDEDVAVMRQQRQKAIQAQQQAELIQQGAVAAKNLSQADTSGQNALTQLIQQGEAGQLVQ